MDRLSSTMIIIALRQ